MIPIQLGPKDMVYLHALLSGAGKGPALMLASPGAVAPNETYYWHVIGHLERCGILVEVSRVRMAKGLGGFAMPAPRRYELTPELAPHAELRTALEHQLKAARKDPSAITGHALLWRELALAELHAYLEWELAVHRFDARWGDALGDALDAGLSSFSIGQMFYFCWTAVRDLASHHLRHPAPFDSYKDYLVQSITGKIERAIRDGWEVRQYSRQWKRRTNALAETFAQHATTLGDRFLTEVPAPQALESLF